MNISAKEVKSLRDKTGSGMMDCKAALVEAEGDIEKAIDILRKKGIAKAAKKSDRTADEGIIWSYIHSGNKIGVMLEVNCETDFVAKTDAFHEFVNNVAMHIAATNPSAISREDTDQTVIEKEREIFTEQAKMENKPEKIIPRIVEGKIDKFYQENCLLEQPFVKDSQKTIKDYLTETISKIGENITLARFTRYQLGESD